MKIKIIFVTLLCSFFSGCSIYSAFYIVNISTVPIRISYSFKNADDSGYFQKYVDKFKVIRSEGEFSIGRRDSLFTYTDTDLNYEIVLYPDEALHTGYSHYCDLLENTQYCGTEFHNLKSISIIKLDEFDSTDTGTDSIYITGNMMCSVIEEIKKNYALVIR